MTDAVTLSAPGLADVFLEFLSSMQLPAAFSTETTVKLHALRELEAAYSYAHGSAAEARTIEQASSA